MYIQYATQGASALQAGPGSAIRSRLDNANGAAPAMKEFSFTGVLWRMGFALALVFVTFNPSGHSYLHWVLGDLQAGRPAKAIVGLALLCAWIFFVRSANAALGTLGFGLIAAFFAAVVWWMASRGWVTIGSGATLAWVALTILGLVLGIGMSWALIRQRVSGQASVDRIDA
jgi:hypothetical protein